MLRKSASFILDKQQNLADVTSRKPENAPPAMEEEDDNINSTTSTYYETRAGHHPTTVTTEWLAQAQAAVPRADGNGGRSSAIDGNEKPLDVTDEFNYWRRKPDLAEAVAAIMALAAVIKRSKAATMMELEIELKHASDTLKMWDETSISLCAGCDLFMRYVTRTAALEYEDFHTAKSRLIERGERFGEISLKARKTIAMLGQDFIVDGSKILVHGFSRVVLALLKMAASNGKQFSVFCTEGRPDNTGIKMSKELVIVGVPVKLIIDPAVAYTMEKVDLVLFGADGVVESGGIINMMGTYQTALVAHSMNKPVYVAAESYKFARLYPLDQTDMSPAPRSINFEAPVPPSVEIEASARDYTPPQYLTLLFTDLGILTPSASTDRFCEYSVKKELSGPVNHMVINTAMQRLRYCMSFEGAFSRQLGKSELSKCEQLSFVICFTQCRG